MGKYALLIGVSRFDDSRLSCLNAPPSDVHALADVLRDPSRGQFDDVATSIDDDLLAIRDKLSALLEERRPRDTVLLYYSGHGIATAGNQLFLATGATQEDRPRARSLPAAELRDMMAESRAGQMIVVLDCCHSGAFMDGAKGSAAPVSEQTFSAGDGAEGQYVLMACNAMQVSLDGAQAASGGLVLSRFTTWLVDGLAQGEAAPAKPEVTLDDLYTYLCRRAREAGSVMTPQRFVRRNAGELVIAANPGARPPELPSDLLERLAQGDWNIRLGAVAELEGLARDDRLRPLVRGAITARLAVERDRDVSNALEATLASLRTSRQAPSDPRPPPGPATFPASRPERQPQSQPQSQPGPEADVRNAPRSVVLDKWEARVVQNLRLAASALSDTGIFVLAHRAKALRLATWYWWSALVCVVLLPGEALMVRSGADPNAVLGGLVLILLCPIGAAIGLFAKQPPFEESGMLNKEDLKLVAGLPIVRSFWRNYERTLFRRSCWLVLAVGVLSLGMVVSH